MPKRMHDTKMEELKASNSLFIQKDQQVETRDLQVDNYYRSISGKTIEQLFSKWTDMVADVKKINKIKVDDINKMLKELMMYGSTESVHIGSVFMQISYRLQEDDYKNEYSDNPFLLMYVGAKLVASIKKDFTGYEVDPRDLLRMKINDIHTENKEILLSEAKERIDKICKDGF
ncbi:hypothetical protein BHS01_06730 [Lactococcus paracarnosus]|uniref:Uncharacterized protein n=1 Tax=Pseudolactococcus paracarnosus TaxID=2749962 RepID=A0A7L4WFU2_9LACT|nr:hypothetical protein BHS01_06730 [Lactococcus paracarnosus]